MSWTDMIAHAPDVPTFVGADLPPYPYISGYGLALRIAAFALPSSVELTRLGFANRKGLDVLRLTQRPSRSRSAFLCALGIDRTGIERFWSPDMWSPMECPGLFDRDNRKLQQCWECSRHGYHCALFQLPSIQRCPWHQCVLSSTCAQCGLDQNAWFDDSGQLGICRCGYRALDRSAALGKMQTFPTADCAQWVEKYLSWARDERSHRVLYLSESTDGWDQVFAELGEPPLELQPKDSRRPAVRLMCIEGAGPDPAPDALWGWSQLDGTQAFRSAPLPRYVFDALEKESRSVLSMYWGDVLMATSGQEAEQPDANRKIDDLASRSLVIAPYGLYQNGQAWLNLSVVDKDVARSCGRTLALTATTFCGTLDVSLSPQASIARSLGLLAGRRHLVGAMLVILCRGYAEGLTGFLNRQRFWPTTGIVPLTSPIIEIQVSEKEVKRVRIGWAGLNATKEPAHEPIDLTWKRRKRSPRKRRTR